MKLPDWIWKDHVTWIFHGLQGAIVLVFYLWTNPSPTEAALIALLYHFGVREGEELFFNPDSRKLRDIGMDFLAPFLGFALILVLETFI
jgi:hypothetical protein